MRNMCSWKERKYLCHYRVTQNAICDMIGTSPSTLKCYPRVRELLEKRVGLHHAYIRSQSRLDEDELIAKVKVMAEELVNLGQPVTRYAIGERVDVPPLVLSRYQRVEIVVKQSIERQQLLHEDELLTRVKIAVRQLEEDGLKHYPRVKSILGQYVKRGPLAKTL